MSTWESRNSDADHWKVMKETHIAGAQTGQSSIPAVTGVAYCTMMCREMRKTNNGELHRRSSEIFALLLPKFS